MLEAFATMATASQGNIILLGLSNRYVTGKRLTLNRAFYYYLINTAKVCDLSFRFFPLNLNFSLIPLNRESLILVKFVFCR